MPLSGTDPTTRFSDRVAHYVRSRPGYPADLIPALQADPGLAPDWTVADVGSGTGLSTVPFLDHGNAVLGIEPNAAMRAAAGRLLEGHPGFQSVDGTAEATGLADHAVDLVVAAQAFHWFRPDDARLEFARILRPGGSVALLWNARRADATPVLDAYEQLLMRFGTDYTQVGHRGVGADRLTAFFSGPFSRRSFLNTQTLDLGGLTSRLLSSSYTPPRGHPDHQPMLDALRDLFGRHQVDGKVSIEYDTDLYTGAVG